jgi:hypothetical protein
MAPKQTEREKKAFAASLETGRAGASADAPERIVPQVFEPVDINRESLLDTRTAHKLRAGKTASFSRVLVVGRYSVEPEALTEAMHEFFAANSGEDFTGAIMYYDGATYTSVACVTLEASTEGLEAFLTSPVATKVFEAARVVSFSDDLAARAWPVFGTAQIKSNSTSVELMEPADLRGALGRTALGCAKIGRSLRELANIGPSVEPEEISAQIAAASELQPAAHFLLSALGTETLFTVERYVELYVAPVKLDLASEKVWPSQEVRLTY